MTLRSFPSRFQETRLFEADGLIYKIKIRRGTSCSGVKFESEESFNQELEAITRTVLGNLNNLRPFYSTHFTVFPYRNPWKGLTKRRRVYPYVLILYLKKTGKNEKQTKKESNVMQQVLSPSEPQPKCCTTDSPLERAIIKDLMEDMEGEPSLSLFGKAEVGSQRAEAKVKEDRARRGKKTHKGADKSVETPGASATGGGASPGEELAETPEDAGGEEAPVRRGIVRRVASYIFPFSRFFRDT